MGYVENTAWRGQRWSGVRAAGWATGTAYAVEWHTLRLGVWNERAAGMYHAVRRAITFQKDVCSA